MVVGYGFMAVDGALAKARMFWDLFVGARLRGRRGTFYGITLLYRKDAKRAIELLATATVEGEIVLTGDRRPVRRDA